jgi:hypothetical protein
MAVNGQEQLPSVAGFGPLPCEVRGPHQVHGRWSASRYVTILAVLAASVVNAAGRVVFHLIRKDNERGDMRLDLAVVTTVRRSRQALSPYQP